MAGSLILSVNGGSSSLKCALFDVSGNNVRLALNVDAQKISDGTDGFVVALHNVINQIRQSYELDQLSAIAHRVVHGGDSYAAPVVVDADVLKDLHELSSLAPLHQPVNLRLIEACTLEFPNVPQIACFDTAFHQNMPAVARDFAIPRALTESGIHRYGFHGISYEFVWEQLQSLYDDANARRVVIAHLGAGASACAIKCGKSIATTMGFSPADGIPMATRTGSIDPGVIVHLMRKNGMSADDLERFVYREGGLLALSGISGGMRDLRTSTDSLAHDAIAYFTYWVTREIGSLIAALGGLDILVFTGGIGANDALIRADVTNALSWNGIKLDEAANHDAAAVISAADSRIDVRIVHTDEEAMVARHALRMLER